MIKKAKFIQVVNPIYEKFIHDYLRIERDNVYVNHAFLPPPLEDEHNILKTYNKKLNEFLLNRYPIIISNAACIRIINGTDAYGLDMCIELIYRLRKDFPNIGLIFAIANEKIHSDYLQKMILKIKKLNIEKNCYFLTGQREIWPLYKKVHLTVRPTSIDGYGSSLAEALYFNCPAIASNVCRRPKGTILFNNRDSDDFFKKCKKIIMKKKY